MGKKKKKLGKYKFARSREGWICTIVLSTLRHPGLSRLKPLGEAPTRLIIIVTRNWRNGRKLVILCHFF